MADTKDLSALLSGDAPKAEPEKPDVQAEVARKLAALNPALKGDGNTQDFIMNMKGQLQAKAPTPKAEAGPNPFAKATNVDNLLEMSQQRYEQEKRDLDAQLMQLNVRIKGLAKKHLNETMDEMARLDPNLSSMVTQEAIKRRKSFLDLLGFSAAAFVDRAKEKRK